MSDYDANFRTFQASLLSINIILYIPISYVYIAIDFYTYAWWFLCLFE